MAKAPKKSVQTASSTAKTLNLNEKQLLAASKSETKVSHKEKELFEQVVQVFEEQEKVAAAEPVMQLAAAETGTMTDAAGSQTQSAAAVSGAEAAGVSTTTWVVGGLAAVGVAAAAGGGGGGGGGGEPAPVPTYTLTAGAAQVTEGNTGTKQLTFKLTLDKAPTSDVTVSYETVAGSATAGEDFVAKTGTVTFKAGETSKDVTIDVNGDTKYEANETLKLKITGSSLAAAAEATGTIVNDDDLLTANVTAVNEGGTVLFTLESNAPVGSKFAYVLSGTGITTADIKSGSLVGEATVGSDGKALIQIDLVEDAATEGAEVLTLTINNQSVNVTVNDTSKTPIVWNISAAQIAQANADNVIVAVQTGNAGNETVNLATDGVTATKGFVITGDANLTVNAGLQGDKITVVGDGNNTINAGTGTGDDNITIIGTGANTINVGAGNDSVTSGSGDDTIVFSADEFNTDDVVSAGDGVDTVVISGNGNVIDAANLVGVEYLKLNGTTVQITEANLEQYIKDGLLAITGEPDSSKVTITAVGGTTIDLTGLGLTGIQQLIVDAAGANTATLKLSAEQIAAVGSIVESTGDTLTLDTTVAGYQALGTKAPNVTVTVTDTVKNLIDAGNTISGVSVTLGEATVAEAQQALALGLTVTYQLRDTAANLALAPVAVFNSASSVEATTVATAAQAAAIAGIDTASTFTATVTSGVSNLVYSVSDTASMLANYPAGLGNATTVTATTVATVAEAAAIATAVVTGTIPTAASYAVVDTASAIQAGVGVVATLDALNAATSVSVSGNASVNQIVVINTALNGAVNGLTAVAAGYALNDNFTQASASNDLTDSAAITTAAGNVTVADATISVLQAQQIEVLSNTGSNAYVLEDAIQTLLTANAAVVGSTTSVSTSTATLTVQQAKDLVAKFGAAKVSDNNLVIEGTAAELLTLSAEVVGEAKSAAGGILMTGTATVDEAVRLKALAGSKLDLATVDVSDSVAALKAAIAVPTTLALLDSIQAAMGGTIALNETASVAEVVAINTALTSELNSFDLRDTAAKLVAATNGEALNAVEDAAKITVDGATTMANVNTIKTASGLTAGTTLVYSILDAAATIITDGNQLRAGATTLSITDASVTVDQAVALKGYAKFDGVYAINDSYAEILGGSKNADLTDAILNAATSVTITDSVTNLQASSSAALTAIAAATTVDRLVVSDTLSNLTAAASGTKSAATAFVLTNSVGTGIEILASDAAAVNTLAALKPATYTVTDAYANLITGTAANTEAIGTLMANASTIQIGTDAGTNNTLVYQALDVSQYNTLDALTPAVIRSDLTDTIAKLSAANAANAVANTLGHSNTVTIGDVGSAKATVEQAETLIARGVTVTGLDISDTAAHIQAMNDATWANVDAITVSDNGEITLSAAHAAKVFSAHGSSYANYHVVDEAAHIASAISGAGVALVNFAKSVVVSDNANYTQAGAFAAATTMGTPIQYSVTIADSDNLTLGAPALNAAVNIVATGAQSVQDAYILNAATNSGTTSYAITASASDFVTFITDANEVTRAANIAAVEAATGTVDATASSSSVRGSGAVAIAALTKAVVYNISDSASNLGLSTVTAAALKEANNISVSDTADAATAAKILSATNTGTTTVAAVSVTAAEAKALVMTSNDTITSLTVTGTTSVADAIEIAAKDTGSNIGTLAFNAISGTTAELLAAPAALLNLAAASSATAGVFATDAMTVAQKNLLGATVDHYSLADSFANLMANSDVSGDVNVDAAITAATTVTITDSSLTIAQAKALLSVEGDGTPKLVYNIVDNDANIVAAMSEAADNAGREALTTAASVQGQQGIALSFATVGDTSAFGIVGTKAQLDALSDVLDNANLIYEVSVADLAANPSFYSTLAANEFIRVTDTYANLTSGNALVGIAKAIVVSGEITSAQAATIAGLSVIDSITYSLADTADHLAASVYLNGATNIRATTAATAAQAETIVDASNSGTTTVSITDTDTAIVAAFAAGAADKITVTGTTGVSAANAATLLAAGSGAVSLAKVTDTSAALAGLTLGASDTITLMAPSDAATVEYAGQMLAKAGSVSYSLTDTAEHLAAAPSAVLNGAVNITVDNDSSNRDVTIAQAKIIDAATNSGSNTFAIVDTAAHVLAASAAELALDGTIVVSDAYVDAATATKLLAKDIATDNVTIASARSGGTYAIHDSVANLTAAANATAVAASTAVTVTGTLTVQEAVAVQAVTGTVDGSNTLTYNLADSYANLVTNHGSASALALANVAVSVSNVLTVAQAKVIDAYASSVTYAIEDTAANVFTDRTSAAVVKATGATSVKLTTAATVAQAAALTDGTINLVGGYAIADSAANVFSALNTANASGAADRGLLEGATSLALTSDALVAEALGSAVTEKRGLYTVDGLTFSVKDTVTNMLAGLAGIDAQGLRDATSLKALDTTAVKVSEATTLLGLSNFAGYDDASTVNVVEHNYYLSDSFVNIQAAAPTLINGAATVVANGTADGSAKADVMNLSMFARAMTINGNDGADNITGTSAGDIINGGAGADSINVGAGVDKVVFASHTDSFSGNVTLGTTDLSAAVDVIAGMGDDDQIQLAGITAASAQTNVALGNAALLVADAVTTDVVTLICGTYAAGKFTAGTAQGDNDYLLQALDDQATNTVMSVVLADITGTVTYDLSATGLVTLNVVAIV